GAVSQNHSWQSTRVPESWQQGARLRKQAKQPTDKKSIGPHRDDDLIAGDKTRRSTDAVNSWAIGQLMFEITAKLVLHPATDTNNDMLRFARFQDCDQRIVSDAVAASL